MSKSDKDLVIERVQTGMRMEKRMVKVLKALAEYLDISLGDLLEGIVLHAFEGQSPFSSQTLQQIARLKEVIISDLQELTVRISQCNVRRFVRQRSDPLNRTGRLGDAPLHRVSNLSHGSCTDNEKRPESQAPRRVFRRVLHK